MSLLAKNLASLTSLPALIEALIWVAWLLLTVPRSNLMFRNFKDLKLLNFSHIGFKIINNIVIYLRMLLFFNQMEQSRY